jgi:hypothetical protein
VHPKKYDAIISEPSNPWIAGIGNLFTEEFFNLCKDRLEPGGVLAQWFHTYDVDDSVFTLVLRTLSASFPHVAVWAPTDLDVILVASAEPIRPDLDGMLRKWSDPDVAAEFRRIEMHSLPSMLSTQLTGGGVPAGAGAVNSEKRPLLEFLAPISFFTHARVEYTAKIDRRDVAGDTTLLISKFRQRFGERAGDYLDIARYQWKSADDDYTKTIEALQASLRLSPDDTDALALYATVAAATNQTEARIGALQRLAALRPNDPAYAAAFAVEYFAWKQSTGAPLEGPEIENALRLMRRCVALSEGRDERFLIRLAEMLTITGKNGEAAEMYAAALDFRKNHEPQETNVTNAELLSRTASACLAAGRRGDAGRWIDRLAAEYPDAADLPVLRQQLTDKKEPD